MQESEPAIGRRRGRPESSRFWPSLRATLIAAAFATAYLSSLWNNFTESKQRTVTLQIPPASADYLQMDANVVRVDLLRSEITTRITFRLAGSLAQDSLRPATDLQLVINTINGRQQFDFWKGQRINPIEAVFPLEGNVNFYPFDHHKGVLWFFVTVPERQLVASKLPLEDPENVVPKELENSPDLPVSPRVLRQRDQIDTRTIFSASIPGLTFKGSQNIPSAEALKGLTGIELHLARSRSVIAISIATMLLMAALSMGVLVMTLKVVRRSWTLDAFFLPTVVSLIFGLPALRSIQPNIPPPGTFGDALVFTWAEIVASGSAVALMVTWLFRRQSDNRR